MAGHATAAMAQDWLDAVAGRLGAALLEAVRRAEFYFFLRSGKCADRNWLVAGESFDFFLGSNGIALVPDKLHGGSCWSFAYRTPPGGRNGIHVRSKLTAGDSAAQLISCGIAATAVVGDLAAGLRPPRMEIPNAHGVDYSAD